MRTHAAGIRYYTGPHKWKVASDFVDSLSEAEMVQFLTDYDAAKLDESDD
jgi:hypothetical protein